MLVAVAMSGTHFALSQEPLDLRLEEVHLQEVEFGYSNVADSADAETAGYEPRPAAVVDVPSQFSEHHLLPPEPLSAPDMHEATESKTLSPYNACMTAGSARHSGICCPVVGPLARHWHYRCKPWLQATYWGYPEYFNERPFGTYVRHAERMQTANGLQNQQVLYRYDFLTGSDAALLSARGVYQLEKIIRRMQFVPGPIVVEVTVDDPELGEARRQNVLDALADLGVPADPEMVVVGRTPLPGLQGTEGVLIYQNLLQQTQQRGVYGGGSSGANTSFGGVGIGAGAAP